MLKRTVRLVLNNNKFGSQTTVEGVHKGDDNSCELIVTLTDGHKEIDLGENPIAVMSGTKPDGTVISNPCEIVEGKIKYTLSKQDTATSGNVLYQVTVADGNNVEESILASAKFTVAVMNNVYIPIYRLLEEEPADWNENYSSYYELAGNAYKLLNYAVCPEFETDTFYYLVNPNYNSEDSYKSFISSLIMLENLIGRASDILIELDEKIGNTTGSVSTGNIADDAVTSAKIASKSVNTVHLADDAVGTFQISDGAVTRDKIEYEAVGEEELADGAVTTEKIELGAVTETELSPELLEKINSKLGDSDNVVQTKHITDRSITTEKIELGAVTNLRIASNAVSTSNIVNGSVTVAKLSGEVREAIASGGSGGTTNYNFLSNRPTLNGVTIEGNLTNDDLGIKNGEDGQDGKDGVSCTHVWSGDTLIVTSASGTSSRNLKGEKGDKGDTGEQGIQGVQGEQGEAGADGYTPVRGIDYYTSEDKAEIVDIVKSEVPLVKSAEQPNFANSVDEMTDTNKVYVMPDGYLYGHKQNVNYNLLKPNEVEFLTRLQDDIEGTTSSATGNIVTGWIPVEYGKYYCMSWLHEGIRQTYPGGASMYKRMNVKKADGTIAVYNSGNCSFASGIEYSKQVITIEHEDAVAMRIHYNLAYVNAPDTIEDLKAVQPMLVEGDTAEQAYQNAINLNYIDGDTESIAEWYNTGLAYNQPADYEERILKLESDVSELEKSDDANDKTEIAELRSRLVGSMDIPNDGYIIGTMYALSLAISEGQIANTAYSHGIVTDYIPCTAGNTITVDSDKYTFQVMEYQEKDTPEVYSGVLVYGTTYTVTQSGYVRICIRYVDNTRIADSYLFNHIVANLTGYYDFSEFEQRTYKPSSSPYYRNVDFGVIPFSYYRGVGDDYTSEGFNKNTTYANYIEAWKSLITNNSSYVTETALGTASDGQMICLYDFKPVRISNQNKSIPKIIIVAGQHGTEKCNVFGWYYFVRDLLNNWNKHPALEYLRNHIELMIVPVVNTYGFDNFTYKNANEVNINRNYDSNWVLLEDTASSQYGGAEPFDQPESRIIRDLILNNEDALMVVDSHICSSESATSYDIMTYCGVCANTDNYYNRMLDVASHHLSSISANFNVDYELNQPDTIMGYMNTNLGNGILRSWATDNNYIGVLTEGFAGFPNHTAYTGEVYKANEEFVVNYLITAMNYLNK